MKKSILRCYPVAYLIASIFLLLPGCKKQGTDRISISGSQAKDGNPNYAGFNWETDSHMMMTVSFNDPLNPALPWTSQSGSPIDPGLVSDYLKKDGWVLVYNTFNPSYYVANESQGGLYFALYNIYRGILRFYLFVPGGVISSGSTNVEHGLSVVGNTSMLNYNNGTEIVDPSAANVTVFTTTNNTGIAVSGGWYVMQYEIAYDPSINSSQVYSNLHLNWNSKTVNVQQINLFGTQQGTITGQVTQPKSAFNWAAVLTNIGVGIAEFFIAGGSSGLSGNSNTGFTGYQQAAQGGLGGTISGLLSAIFGGNSNNAQEVDLKMKTSISLQGSLSGSQPLAPNAFVIPGESTSYSANNNSYPPLYTTSSMGVFNISNRPTVKLTSTKQTNIPQSFKQDHAANTPYYFNTFQLVSGSFTLNINSVDQPYASIYKQDILLMNFDAGDEYYSFTPNIENIGGSPYYNVTQGTTDGILLRAANLLAVVRITLKVTPPNGGAVSYLTKSFVANVTN